MAIAKKRIGNTIEFRFNVTTNGLNTSLVGRDIKIVLRDPKGNSVVLSSTISDGNKVCAKFEGTEQKQLGVYWIEVYENRGLPDQAVLDFDAVELVARTKQEK